MTDRDEHIYAIGRLPIRKGIALYRLDYPAGGGVAICPLAYFRDDAEAMRLVRDLVAGEQVNIAAELWPPEVDEHVPPQDLDADGGR